jgi:hypothetical protein
VGGSRVSGKKKYNKCGITLVFTQKVITQSFTEYKKYLYNILILNKKRNMELKNVQFH